MVTFFTLIYFLTVLDNFLYKWIFLKTQNESKFLQNRIFINSFYYKVSFYKVRTKLLNQLT